MYGVGCILYSYLSQLSAFNGKTFLEVLEANINGRIDFTKIKYQPELKNVAECLLDPDLKKRPLASEISRNPMFGEPMGNNLPSDHIIDETKNWYSVSELYKPGRPWESCESLAKNEENQWQSVQKYIDKDIFCSIHDCNQSHIRMTPDFLLAQACNGKS